VDCLVHFAVSAYLLVVSIYYPAGQGRAQWARIERVQEFYLCLVVVSTSRWHYVILYLYLWIKKRSECVLQAQLGSTQSLSSLIVHVGGDY
jgi:hypothetical protein